jgi:hypothetical protein
VYLFAEPLRDAWTRVITDANEAAALAEDDSHVLVAVPKNQMRLNASKGAAKLIAKHIPENKGRAAKDPRSSKARYHLNTAVQTKGLKLAFDCYDLRHGCSVDGIPERVPKHLPRNVRIAHGVGLRHAAPNLQQDDDAKAEEKQALSTQVPRYLRLATNMIETAAKGYVSWRKRSSK